MNFIAMICLRTACGCVVVAEKLNDGAAFALKRKASVAGAALWFELAPN